jgi:hypothetical protein
VRGHAVGCKTLPHLCHPLLQSKALEVPVRRPALLYCWPLLISGRLKPLLVVDMQHDAASRQAKKQILS